MFSPSVFSIALTKTVSWNGTLSVHHYVSVLRLLIDKKQGIYQTNAHKRPHDEDVLWNISHLSLIRALYRRERVID